jgi:hypothetical protein
MDHQQHPHQSNVPGMCLDPELEKGRQAIRGLDFFIHFMLMEHCHPVYLIYIAPFFLGAIAGGLAWAAAEVAPDSPGHVLPLSSALAVGVLALCFAALAVWSPMLGFWRVNALAKLLTLALVLRLTVWPSIGGGRHPFADAVMAFVACAISEMLWNVWRSHRRQPDEDGFA